MLTGKITKKADMKTLHPDTGRPDPLRQVLVEIYSDGKGPPGSEAEGLVDSAYFSTEESARAWAQNSYKLQV